LSALWQILDPACVELELKAGSKQEALEQMVGLLAKAGRIKDSAALLELLQAREKMGSTGIGGGIAIPHCASPEPAAPAFALARKREGLVFDALDGQPVLLLFLLVGQKGRPSAQLRLLSRLARLLREPAFIAGLMAAGSPEEVVDLLRRTEELEG
jgi:fructose PTS system EIIBC or EIIC component